MPTGLLNPAAATATDGGPGDAPRRFHSRLPDYRPSPLVDAARVAEELGVRKVWVKDESSRLGLPSFKVLGASWGAYRALEAVAAQPFGNWADIDELGALVRQTTSIRRLAAATDGNHGRAVARIARWLGLEASIYVPSGTALARVDAIAAEGAEVTHVAGSYAAAVGRAAEEANARCLVVADTSWPGYTTVPGWVIEGYSTILAEVDDQLASSDVAVPDVVVVQIGVGALAAAVVRHYRGTEPLTPRVLGVEPVSAACVMASVRSGEIQTVPDPHRSVMAGLNCDSPSMVALPDMSAAVDAFVAVEDEFAYEAMRLLAADGVVSGETGAAGLAGLLALRTGELRAISEALQLSETSSVLLLSTEGATDPQGYDAVVQSSCRSLRSRVSR